LSGRIGVLLSFDLLERAIQCLDTLLDGERSNPGARIALSSNESAVSAKGLCRSIAFSIHSRCFFCASRLCLAISLSRLSAVSLLTWKAPSILAAERNFFARYRGIRKEAAKYLAWTSSAVTAAVTLRGRIPSCLRTKCPISWASVVRARAPILLASS